MRKVMLALLRSRVVYPAYRLPQRSTAFGARHPQLAPDRRDESLELARLMRNGRCRAPDRLGPAGIARAPRDHVHMQLWNHITERRHVELVARGHLLESAPGAGDLGHQLSALDLIEIDDLARVFPARHQQQPGPVGIIDDEYAREREIADRNGVAGELRM